MSRMLLTLAVIFTLSASLYGQAKTYDYTNMTPKQIEQLKQDRHAFYTAESAGKQDAIREHLILESSRVDGNQASYDVRYYGLHLDLNFSAGTVNNHIDYRIQSTVPSLSSVDLNLVNQLVVDSIFVGGSPAFFNHIANLLTITLPTSYSNGAQFDMTVYYHGTPSYAGQQGMSFGNVAGYQMCYTNCEPYGSRNWWPCKDYPLDKPDSIDVWVKYPSAYKCVSNGKIMSDVSIGGGRNEIHYHHNYPISTYLIAITCSTFDMSIQNWVHDGDTTPVYSYTVPSWPSAKTAFETYMIPVLNAESNAYGLYPFADEKAGNAHYGWGGAMEHQTCSYYNPSFYDDWVIAHETGHQWYGDMFTNKTFNHIWLHEGFASYSEPLFVEARYGFTAYKNYLQSQKYLGPGTIYVENVNTDDIFDNNLSYDKASWVVHMLRGVVGDDMFFNGVLADWYNSKYRYGAVTTEDFDSVTSNAVGQDMSWFFNEWIYGDGHPDYQYAFACSQDSVGGYDMFMILSQVQTYGTLFKMPIRMVLHTTGADIDTTLWNEAEAVQVFELNLPDSVTSISFDPDQWILRTVSQTSLSTTFVPSSVPMGYLNIPYYAKLRAVGGVAPYHWTFMGGDLPYGTTFEGDTVGVIQGTPSYPATYYFTVYVEDDDPGTNDGHNVSMSIEISAQAPYVAGDADGSGSISVADAVYLINYIFGGGPAPDPVSAGDADCSGGISIGDAVYVINYIFGGGPAPANCEAN